MIWKHEEVGNAGPMGLVDLYLQFIVFLKKLIKERK